MLKVRGLNVNDIEEIVELEKVLYKSPWNLNQFKYELDENEVSYMYVLENDGVIVGYYGFWVMFDEIDITKVSIRKEFQGMKLSNVLMEDCFSRVKEVRVDNIPAISLYKKHGFKEIFVRKDYYGKGEDALMMVKEMED